MPLNIKPTKRMKIVIPIDNSRASMNCKDR